jgi:putative SbcD/Mre11-related phosphoesterase
MILITSVNHTNSVHILDDKPAIVIDEKRKGTTLLVADLHMGYLYGQNKKGILIPKPKLPEIELLELAKEIKPKRLVILGDFKDEIFGMKNPLVSRIMDFYNEIRQITRLIIVKGNHDGKIEEMFRSRIQLIPATGFCLTTKDDKKIGLWHGHSNPALDVINADITITAHLHPAYSFRDKLRVISTEKVWIKARWLHTTDDKERLHIIMPAFNRYVRGRSVDKDSFNTLLTLKEGIDFKNAEVFTLQGVLLGTIGDLQEARKRKEE